MYDELVNSLRELCEMTALCEDYSCFECPYEEKCSSYKNGRLSAVYKQSTDAIEELSRENESLVKSVNEASEILRRRWIPVTERLPDDWEMVIGFTPCDGFMFVGFHVTSIYHDHDFSHWNIVTAMRSTRKMTKKVTHWMPLPTPPKEEQA